MKEVNEIRSQIGTLQAKIVEAKKRLEEAGLRKLGLSIGDRITTNKGLVEVTGCDAARGYPRPLGVKVKKDGTAGEQSAGRIGSDEWTKA